MSDERFQLVMQVFEQAVSLDAPSRARLLASSDPAIGEEVRALLAHHDSAGAVATGGGLAAVGGDPGAPELHAPLAPLPVLKGNYRILRTIGEGGMGIVFEAEQAFPRRRVALKAVRPGFASRSLLRRFRNEVELLGRLQHPGIAQLYEAGVADEDTPDQAFFAMELVDGRPLAQFAREHNLDARARWFLLLKVCEAVQHAHQRGVIHRDLKPGNILVTPDGQPKVVDFGIARAAEESNPASIVTRTGQLIGTPSYMSPEQMRGGDVDTRSDVYALGVVGFELLASRLPFDLAGVGLPEAARIIREDEAPPISRFDRSLRGDAEIIIMKALAKEPDRRYASAGELAEDIRRFLAGDAIAARRDSAIYLLRKQVRRHKGAARLIALAVIGLVGFSIYAQINAQRQHTLALAATQARDQERVAKERAMLATEQALKAKEEALAARAAAVSELTQSNIERGRTEAANGNLPLAEDMLWREYFADTTSTSAWWGLWELYDRIPSSWLIQAPYVVGVPAVSADQCRVAWVTGNQRVVVYDAQSGAAVRDLPLPGGGASCIALSSDAGRVFVANPKVDATLLDSDGNATLLPDSAGIRAAAFSPDGLMLVSTGPGPSIRLWRLDTASLLHQWTAPAPMRYVAFSPAGDAVAAAMDQPAPSGGVCVWSALDGRLVASFAAPLVNGLSAMAFDDDPSRLLLGERSGDVLHWKIGEQRPQVVPRPYGSGVVFFAPDPLTSAVLAGALDRASVLDPLGGRDQRLLPRQRFTSVAGAWNGPEDVTILTNDGILRRQSLSPNPSATRISGFPGWCFSVAFDPSGRRLAVGTGNGTVDILDAATGSPVTRWTSQNPEFRSRGVRFLSDDSLLATHQDGVLRMLDPSTGAVQRTMPGEKSEIFSLDVSPGKDLAAVGFANRVTRLFDLRSGESIATIPALEKRIEGLAFSPDGKWLVISGLNRGVVVWDVALRQVSRRLETASGPWGICFLPDGSRMFVSTQAGEIEVFDTQSWSRLRVIQGHQRLIPAIAVSPDGRFFATGGEDALVKLWDASTLRNLASFDTAGVNIVNLTFSPDSRRLVGASANRFVIQYDLAAAGDRIHAHEAYYRRRFPSPAPAPRRD